MALNILTPSVIEPVETKTVSKNKVSEEILTIAFLPVIKESFLQEKKNRAAEHNISSKFFMGLKIRLKQILVYFLDPSHLYDLYIEFLVLQTPGIVF